MAKSSINIQPVKASSEIHNWRKKDLDYVRQDLTPTNESWSRASVSEILDQVKARYQEKVGQKMQAKSTPVREGVFLFDKHHTIEDAKQLADKIEQRFGIKTFQIHMHRDEGHKKSDEWKQNLHGHMLFDWTDHTTGKSIKLNREDMAELQTLVAQELGMERGVASDRKHLSAQQFKQAKAMEELELQHTNANKALSEIELVLTALDTRSGEIVAQKRNLIGHSIDIEETTKNAKALILENERLRRSIETEKIYSKSYETRAEKLRKNWTTTEAELKAVLKGLHQGKKIKPEYIKSRLGIQEPKPEQSQQQKRGINRGGPSL